MSDPDLRIASRSRNGHTGGGVYEGRTLLIVVLVVAGAWRRRRRRSAHRSPGELQRQQRSTLNIARDSSTVRTGDVDQLHASGSTTSATGAIACDVAEHHRAAAVPRAPTASRAACPDRRRRARPTRSGTGDRTFGPFPYTVDRQRRGHRRSSARVSVAHGVLHDAPATTTASTSTRTIGSSSSDAGDRRRQDRPTSRPALAPQNVTYTFRVNNTHASRR